MRKIFAILIVILCGHANISALEGPGSGSYHQLTGVVDRGITVRLLLVRVGDSIYGSCAYSAKSVEPLKKSGIDGASSTVYGKISASGDFLLHVWGDDEAPRFSGRFMNNEMVVGFWLNEKAAIGPVPVDLRVNDAPGSLPFVVTQEFATQKLVEKKKSPAAKLKMVLLTPGTSASDIAKDSIERIIIGGFSDHAISKTEPQQILESIKQDYFADYLNSNKALIGQSPGASLDWEHLRFSHIIFNENYMLTFMILTYEFTGGAHGMETQKYMVADLKSGKRINLEDIFLRGYEAELTTLLTNKLRNMSGLTGQGKLTDSGYFADQINPTENFYVNANGIGFVYDPYEIAPYAFGSIRIFLTREELGSILRQP